MHSWFAQGADSGIAASDQRGKAGGRAGKSDAGAESERPWDDWVADYSRIRASIAETYPDIFHDYEWWMWEPGGFHRPLAARERVRKTKTGKANFITPRGLDEDLDMPEVGHDVLRMVTLRSNDQFNATIYRYTDRFRGVHGTRMVALMRRDDIDRLGLTESGK